MVLTFALSHKNLTAGTSTPEGCVAQAIKTEISADLGSMLTTLASSDSVTHNDVEKLFAKNAHAIASIKPPTGYIQHFVLEGIAYSPDKKEAAIRVACIFLPPIAVAVKTKVFSEIPFTTYTRYYTTVLVDSEWKLSVRANEPVIQQLLKDDTYARRIFFLFHDGEVPPEGNALAKLASDAKRLLVNFATFAQSKYWHSFEVFCEPQPIISLGHPVGTPESAVVRYMEYQKQGDIDSVNELLIEAAREKNEKLVREVGKKRASAFMKKLYAKYGDSFTLFVKGKPVEWPDNKSLISLAGVGLASQWQVNSFTIVRANVDSFSLFPHIDDASLLSVLDQKYSEIFPLWVSELNYKKCLLHLPL